MIEQIIIENYKSIREATIILGKINLLIGGNGAGKSNFISLFDLLYALYTQRLGGYSIREGGFNRLLHNGVKYSDHITALLDFDNTNTLEIILKPALTSGKLYIDRTGDFFNNNNDTQKKYYSNWNYTSWDQSVEESSILTNRRWRAGYLRSYISGVQVFHFHDTSITSALRRPCNINDNISLKADGSNLPACLYRMQETQKQSFCLLESIIHSVAPYFKKFVLKPSAIQDDIIHLVWEDMHSDAFFDAYSFSDGTLRFIALATLLLQPQKPETIIVDEPELGLHPFAIVKLAALFRKASFESQIIVATQSTNFIDQFEAEDVITVDRMDNQSVFNRLDKSELSEWENRYSLGDIWEKNLIGGQP